MVTGIFFGETCDEQASTRLGRQRSIRAIEVVFVLIVVENLVFVLVQVAVVIVGFFNVEDR
jgi:hypothetical protein